MLKRRIWIIVGLVLLLIVPPSLAARFTVRHIQVQGNQRLSSAAVIGYVPVHVGQIFDTKTSADVVSSLYKSGYFNNVQLLHRGGTLIVRVQELPIISKFTVTGNKAIKDKRLKPALKKLGLQVGDVYHENKINEFKEGIKAAYQNLGRYDIAIKIHVQKMPYNTVAVSVKIKEGAIAVVHDIHIMGNKAFSEGTLLSQFTLTTPSLFRLTFWTHRDRYSPYQLEKDIESLKEFYYNHGYLDFKVLSKKITISPNHRRVKIVIRIHEGPVYRISGYKVVGKFSDDPMVRNKINIKAGERFSREKFVEIDKKIGNYFMNKGYAFPDIKAVPKLNRTNATVFLTFYIKPGHRVYVRQIHFKGNERTKGKVLRYQMRQLEGSLYSSHNIKESKRRIANLPYFKDIKIATVRVPGAPNQVDLNYHVTEQNAGRASVQGGYSDVDGFLYGASVTEPNFMGTGKMVSLGFQRSQYSSQYSFGYTNPFYTTYGMSRSINMYYTHTTPGDVNLDTYTMDTYGGSLSYSVPISEYNYFSFGASYSHVNISNVNGAMVSPSAFQFTLLHPSPYNQFIGTLGFVHSHLDRAIFPTVGSLEKIAGNIGAPIVDNSLAYYTVTFDGKWYFPVSSTGLIFHPHVLLGYGNGYSDVNSLPFFYNFFGGGIQTLPGYEPNTLGPQNPNDPGTAVGGNVEIFGGLNLIFPNGISSKVRTQLFVDFGNIFQTHHTAGNPGNPSAGATVYDAVSLENLRGSAGLMVSWFSPIGIITVAYGVPFNVKGAQVQQFGFTFGGSI